MSNSQNVEQVILDLESRRLKAVMDADIDVLNEILSDDLTYTHTTAALDTKQSFTDALKSGALNYERMVSDDGKVKVYGDTAIVNGTADVGVTSRGQQLKFGLRYTVVYVKQDGQWRMVVWQATRLPES